jgi:TRAP-type C4-dicarboxylate transport system permease large subunit
VFYAGAIGMIVFRELSLAQLVADLRGAMIDSAAIMLIIAFTSAFGQVLIRAQLPDQLAAMATTLTSDATVFLLLMILLWLVVGCFMAQTPAILILTPILLPVAEQYAIDPIHFGMVMALTLTLGLLTPPVGMVLYALVKVSGVKFERLVVVSFPYVVITALVSVVLVLVPDLVLALPRLAR